MFELNLSNDRSSEFLVKSTSRISFDVELHENFNYSDKNIIINGIKYKEEKDDFFETDDHILLTCGKIYHQLSVSTQVTALNAKEILDLYLTDDLELY